MGWVNQGRHPCYRPTVARVCTVSSQHLLGWFCAVGKILKAPEQCGPESRWTGLWWWRHCGPEPKETVAFRPCGLVQNSHSMGLR